MTRSHILYADGSARCIAHHGIDVSVPVAGFYRGRLVSGGVRGGIRIWFGPPHDPVTGEEMDRSWRWQAEFNGEPCDFDRVWPACADEAITEAEYRTYCQRAEWARQQAPASAYADPRKRVDPLNPSEPLPF